MFVYGLLYIFLTAMPAIFRGVYQETPGIAGLNYIAVGIGVTGASQTFAFFSDGLYAKLKQRYGTGKPEYRLCKSSPPSSIPHRSQPVDDVQVAFFPASVMLPAGLLITGWVVEYKAHWVCADIVGAIANLELGLCILLNLGGVGYHPHRRWGCSRYPKHSGICH